MQDLERCVKILQKYNTADMNYVGDFLTIHKAAKQRV